MHICLHLDNIIIPWESTNQADFVDQSFVRLQAVLRVFRGFDGLYGVSGSKVMAKRPEINQRNSHKSPREFVKNLGSFGPNFGTRSARKSTKGSKDSYYILESKQTLSHYCKSVHCCSDDVIKEKAKKAKHSPILTSSTKNPKPKS